MDTWIILGLIVAAIVWLVLIYNRLVSLKNRFDNAFSQIEVQLKRRYDLIPNLVEIAKTYLSHERETLEAVVAARNQAMDGLAKAAKNPADGAAMQEFAGELSVCSVVLLGG